MEQITELKIRYEDWGTNHLLHLGRKCALGALLTAYGASERALEDYDEAEIANVLRGLPSLHNGIHYTGLWWDIVLANDNHRYDLLKRLFKDGLGITLVLENFPAEH